MQNLSKNLYSRKFLLKILQFFDLAKVSAPKVVFMAILWADFVLNLFWIWKRVVNDKKYKTLTVFFKKYSFDI